MLWYGFIKWVVGKEGMFPKNVKSIFSNFY